MKLIFSQYEGAGLPNALNKHTGKGKFSIWLNIKKFFENKSNNQIASLNSVTPITFGFVAGLFNCAL